MFKRWWFFLRIAVELSWKQIQHGNDLLGTVRVIKLAWLLTSEEGKRRLSEVEELRGKDLVCWCHTWDGIGDNPNFCHADILLELASPHSE